MSINGKRDKISTEDILKVAKEMNIKKAKSIIDKVKEVVNNWSVFAAECEIPKSQIEEIAKNHNLNI
jgi:serine/threonine-protein kinase HipA